VCETKTLKFVDPSKNGLTYEMFDGHYLALPDLDTLAVVKKGRVFEFGYGTLDVPKFDFLLRITGYVDFVEEGEYTFYVVSNDGHHLVVEKSGMCTLTPGRHEIMLTYFQAEGGRELKVLYEGPGIEKQEIPVSKLFFE